MEILVDALPRALYVPLEAVVQKDSARVVYVAQGSRYQPRQVTLGLWNENDIVVDRGVSKGERVALRDPTVKLALSQMRQAEARSGAVGGP